MADIDVGSVVSLGGNGPWMTISAVIPAVAGASPQPKKATAVYYESSDGTVKVTPLLPIVCFRAIPADKLQ